jgi:hypothetical protein
MKVWRSSIAAAMTAVAVLALAGTAQAQLVIGQLAPPSHPAECNLGPFDIVPVTVGSGSNYTVPEAGVITSWSTSAALGQGQTLVFKVFRPVAPATVLIVAHDGPRPLQPGVVNTFPVHVPVLAGDIVGVDDDAIPALASPSACVFLTGEGGDRTFEYAGNAADGVTIGPEHENGFEFRPNISATFLGQPRFTTTSRLSLGSVKGGAKVVLGGANFAEVSRVSFGGVAARSFEVDSEQQITAVVGAGKSLRKVAAEVTTSAGTAKSTSVFFYRGCKVPGLTGKSLAAAKSQLRRAGCRLGAVKSVSAPAAKKGKVVGQNPRPGKLLAPGAKVGIKLGK